MSPGHHQFVPSAMGTAPGYELQVCSCCCIVGVRQKPKLTRGPGKLLFSSTGREGGSLRPPVGPACPGPVSDSVSITQGTLLPGGRNSSGLAVSQERKVLLTVSINPLQLTAPHTTPHVPHSVKPALARLALHRARYPTMHSTACHGTHFPIHNATLSTCGSLLCSTQLSTVSLSSIWETSKPSGVLSQPASSPSSVMSSQ